MNEGLQEVLECLSALNEEDDVNKRFKDKTEEVIAILNSDEQLIIEKALLKLEELNSFEMSSYLRTQVWDVISMLESLNN